MSGLRFPAGNFKGTDFSESNLSNVNLSGKVNFDQVKFVSTNLNGVNLTKGTLLRAFSLARTRCQVELANAANRLNET